MILTGFEEYELLGTGMLVRYYDELPRIIGEREVECAPRRAVTGRPGDEEAFRHLILDDPRYGPVARNVVLMWYLGTWTQLPREWRSAFGATSYDTDHVVSAGRRYRAGLGAVPDGRTAHHDAAVRGSKASDRGPSHRRWGRMTIEET